MENKKKKRAISTVLLSLFFTIAMFLGAAIYALPKYLFIDVNEEFNPADSSQALVIAKDKKLKLPNFSMFKGDKFNSLERGYWHVFNEDDFEVGNNKPFERIIEEDEEGEKEEGEDIK